MLTTSKGDYPHQPLHALVSVNDTGDRVKRWAQRSTVGKPPGSTIRILSLTRPETHGKDACTRSMVPYMATKKVTVTIPEDLLDEIRADAAERGLSAYVAEALRFKRDRDRLLELVDWLQEEHGTVTEDERTAALVELDDLDAEHERRRATRTRGAGEAA